jgi:hypothetical protein
VELLALRGLVVQFCRGLDRPRCHRLTDTRSGAEWHPASSGLVTGGGADLLCDRRRAGTSHLGTARPDQSVDKSRDYTVEGRRMPKELTPSGQPPEAI